MPITKFLQEPKKLEVQQYDGKKNIKGLRETHIPFSGSPRKHPYDKDKFILIADPYTSSFYYEFENSDVEFAEELPNIIDLDNNVIKMIMIWVKKQSIAIRCTPFIVDNFAAIK